MGVAQPVRAIPLGRLYEYLSATGWARLPDEQLVSTWNKRTREAELQIVLPLEPGLADQDEVVDQALRVLAWAERRSVDEVATDVQYGGADVVSVRLAPDAPSGEAPLPMAEAAVKALRSLVIGSAATLDYGGPYLPGRSMRAERYSQLVRLSTHSGSFVVSLSLPLYEPRHELRIEPTPGQVEMLANGEILVDPFGRHVAARIRDVAQKAVELASSVASHEEDLTVFEAEPMASGNAAELSALANLGGLRESGYDLRLAPSPILPNGESPRMVHVTGQHRLILARAGSLLRRLKPATGVTVSGSVIGLTRGSGLGPLIAVIRGRASGARTEHRYHALLGEDQHREAIRAYEDDLPVAAAGDLVVRGNYLVLTLEEFTVHQRLGIGD
jgi:hypothetical protein